MVNVMQHEYSAMPAKYNGQISQVFALMPAPQRPRLRRQLVRRSDN